MHHITSILNKYFNTDIVILIIVEFGCMDCFFKMDVTASQSKTFERLKKRRKVTFPLVKNMRKRIVRQPCLMRWQVVCKHII
jgi:hypothetical protein